MPVESRRPAPAHRRPLLSWAGPVLGALILTLAASAKDPATYVGTDTCKTCHEEVVNAFKKNRHLSVETAPKYEKWNKQACESCHGPGSKHAESADPKDIIQPAKLAP